MTISSTIGASLRAACLATAMLALGACEVRRDADATADEPVTTPSTQASETPEPAPSSVSIIREDVDPPAPKPSAVAEPIELVLPFPDGANMSPAVERMLVGVLQSDAIKQGWPVILGGHTDSSGNDLANLRASRSRAETVAAWLVEHGVADSRIQVIAFGEQNPLAANAKPDGTPDELARRSNRRVELQIAPPASPAIPAAAAGTAPESAEPSDQDA